MILESLDPAAARPQAQAQNLAKDLEPEPSRPVQGTAKSLESGLDVNRDRYDDERKVDEREREPDPDATAYDARGNPKERRTSESPPPDGGDRVDLFV